MKKRGKKRSINICLESCQYMLVFNVVMENATRADTEQREGRGGELQLLNLWPTPFRNL